MKAILLITCCILPLICGCGTTEMFHTGNMMLPDTAEESPPASLKPEDKTPEKPLPKTVLMAGLGEWRVPYDGKANIRSTVDRLRTTGITGLHFFPGSSIALDWSLWAVGITGSDIPDDFDPLMIYEHKNISHPYGTEAHFGVRYSLEVADWFRPFARCGIAAQRLDFVTEAYNLYDYPYIFYKKQRIEDDAFGGGLGAGINLVFGRLWIEAGACYMWMGADIDVHEHVFYFHPSGGPTYYEYDSLREHVRVGGEPGFWIAIGIGF
ncbi:MAG: hypothetical protein ACYS8W_10770 [Planctomycetota bacterium]